MKVAMSRWRLSSLKSIVSLGSSPTSSTPFSHSAFAESTSLGTRSPLASRKVWSPGPGEIVGGQRAVLEYLLGERLPVEADHERFADVEVVQPWRMLVQPPVDGKGQREPEEVGVILELLDLVTL